MISILLPFPCPIVAVDHSPAPSTVRIAESSKCDVKKLDAACDMWWSQNRIFEPGTPMRFDIIDLIHSLSEIQRCIDSRNTAEERGNVAIAERSMRSNLT